MFTLCLGDKRRLWRDCAYVQIRMRFCCSPMQYVLKSCGLAYIIRTWERATNKLSFRTSNSFARSDTGIVIDSEARPSRTCKTSLLFAPLAVRIQAGCSILHSD